MGKQADLEAYAIDLNDFHWYGASKSRGRRSAMATVRVYGRGLFRMSVHLTAQVQAVIPDEGMAKVMVGVAPHAIALRIVDETQITAAPLNFSDPGSKSGRSHAVFSSVAAHRALRGQGVQVPTTLNAVFYPEQKVVYIELPRSPEALEA